jgi:nucleotide-binding universal stress UspA family protein
MFKEIVVAFDGSEHAEAAVRTACDVAKRYDARLHLVHVPELYDQSVAVAASGMAMPVRPETLEDMGERMVERGTRIAKEAGVSPASTDIRPGPPADAIVSAAEDQHADLIVSGRRGLGNLTGALLGSVTQAIASRADCAVLTVKKT